ncbi:MAG: hypothetical protein AAFU67_06820, partial [Bacteroidota bacterium]
LMWYAENDTYLDYPITSPAYKFYTIAPAPPLRSYLIAAGANSVLQNWHNTVQKTEHGNYIPVGYNVYILVGVFGQQGQGFEAMATTSLTDRPPSASMRLTFTPQLVDGDVMFTPSLL